MRCHSSNQKEMQEIKKGNGKHFNGLLNRLDTTEGKKISELKNISINPHMRK